jgi:hypothetical protein
MHRTILVGLLALGFGAGCGGGSVQQPTYAVSGRVMFAGKPVPGATVVFHPVDKTNFKWDERPQAKTDDNGNFNLFTYKPGDGAPAGEYRVAVALLPAEAEDGADQVKRVKNAPKLPPQYADPNKSGLTATIKPESNTLEPFDLK